MGSLKLFQIPVFYFFTLCFLSLVLITCSSRKKKGEAIAVLQQPGNYSSYQLGKDVPIKFDFKNKHVTIDSISCLLDGKNVALIKSEATASYVFHTQGHTLGEHAFTIQVFYEDYAPDTYQGHIILLSDTAPANYAYQIIQKYPHDTADFIQGLCYENGIMYEGTGLEGHSRLKKYELKNGKILQEKKLPDDIFGEGITVMNHKVFQLSYKDKKGFIYNTKNLEQQGSFNWQLEGWGLTQDSAHLIVSTGSQYLFFVDTSNFKVIRRVQVADHKKLIKNINELEYVDGHVWANIWETDEVIEIDPVSGKVLGRLNLKGILQGYEAEKQKENVLNGIAYNTSHKSFYITGKSGPFYLKLSLKPEA